MSGPGSGSLECRVAEFAVAGFKKLDTKSEGTANSAHFTSPFGDFLLDPFSFAQEVLRRSVVPSRAWALSSCCKVCATQRWFLMYIVHERKLSTVHTGSEGTMFGHSSN